MPFKAHAILDLYKSFEKRGFAGAEFIENGALFDVPAGSVAVRFVGKPFDIAGVPIQPPFSGAAVGVINSDKAFQATARTPAIITVETGEGPSFEHKTYIVGHQNDFENVAINMDYRPDYLELQEIRQEWIEQPSQEMLDEIADYGAWVRYVRSKAEKIAEKGYAVNFQAFDAILQGVENTLEKYRNSREITCKSFESAVEGMDADVVRIKLRDAYGQYRDQMKASVATIVSTWDKLLVELAS